MRRPSSRISPPLKKASPSSVAGSCWMRRPSLCGGRRHRVDQGHGDEAGKHRDPSGTQRDGPTPSSRPKDARDLRQGDRRPEAGEHPRLQMRLEDGIEPANVVPHRHNLRHRRQQRRGGEARQRNQDMRPVARVPCREANRSHEAREQYPRGPGLRAPDQRRRQRHGGQQRHHANGRGARVSRAQPSGHEWRGRRACQREHDGRWQSEDEQPLEGRRGLGRGRHAAVEIHVVLVVRQEQEVAGRRQADRDGRRQANDVPPARGIRSPQAVGQRCHGHDQVCRKVPRVGDTVQPQHQRLKCQDGSPGGPGSGRAPPPPLSQRHQGQRTQERGGRRRQVHQVRVQIAIDDGEPRELIDGVRDDPRRRPEVVVGGQVAADGGWYLREDAPPGRRVGCVGGRDLGDLHG